MNYKKKPFRACSNLMFIKLLSVRNMKKKCKNARIFKDNLQTCTKQKFVYELLYSNIYNYIYI